MEINQRVGCREVISGVGVALVPSSGEDRHRHAIEQVSACRVDGVEVDATIQHNARKFDFYGRVAARRKGTAGSAAPSSRPARPGRCGRRRSRPRTSLLGIKQVAVARGPAGVESARPPARLASTAFAASPAVPSVPRTDAASAYVSK